MIVVDASVTLAWVLADETVTGAEAVLDRIVTSGALVPSVWPMEVTNSLVVAYRRQRLASDQLQGALETLAALPISVIPTGLDRGAGRILNLCHRHGLTAYDAAYLDLAIEHGLGLATLDRRLVSSASAEQVPLII